MIQPTDLKYMMHGLLSHDRAHLIAVIPEEPAGKMTLILDSTIFYPQGGGQPADHGTIQNNVHSAVFCVEDVRFKDGIVHHIGTLTSGAFQQGDEVELYIDEKRRTLNSRNHTAGHIIDCAFYELGFLLPPASGYHFPQGAYIAYHGTLEENERTNLLQHLQRKVDEIITRALPVTIEMMSLEKLKHVAKFIPDALPKNKPIRAMIVQGYPAIPCGGTHVLNTWDVGRVVIEKISNKKNILRISYSVMPT